MYNIKLVFPQEAIYSCCLLQVASKWHTDVALFLLEHGADPNKTDYLGRTPLHVAAADDYPDMVKLLIENGGGISS